MKMKVPSLKEMQKLHETVTISEHKKKQLLTQNKEAARALLSSLSFPQVYSITEKKKDVNS